MWWVKKKIKQYILVHLKKRKKREISQRKKEVIQLRHVDFSLLHRTALVFHS